MTPIQVHALSKSGIEVLGQLFVHGPTSDGNLVSKWGRNELVNTGLAFRLQGFNALTPDGLQAALDWDLRQAKNGQWYCKQRDLRWPRRLA